MIRSYWFALITFFLFPALLQGQERIPFTILHTNDEHSHLIPHPAVDDHPEMENPSTGGFARLGGMVQQIKNQKSETGEPVLLFSAGDFIGGPAFGWLALNGYAAELDLMQQIGYDAVVIGNHEFDFGTEVLADYLKTSGYPEAHRSTVILGTNLIIPEDHLLAEAEIKKTMLKTLENGLNVGVFGLIGEDAISKTAFPEPVTFEYYVDAAAEAVQELKEQGADVIISVNHSGQIEDRNLAQEVDGIDVIVGGHFHTPLYEPIIEGNTVIVQAGAYTEYLGQLELYWLPDEKRVEVRNNENDNPFLIRLDHSTPVDAAIHRDVERYEKKLSEWIDELTEGAITDIRDTIVKSEFPLNRAHKQESAIGNFITDAMRMVTGDVTGRRVDVAVQANGAIRGSIKPGRMPWSEGEVSFYDLMVTTGLGSGPDGNPGYPVVAFYLTGEEVRRVMEVSVLLSEMLMDNYFLQFSGIRKEYDPGRALWLTVPIIDQPLPSSRSVLNAEIFEGEGIQDANGMRPLEKSDQSLYHVVTDYYIAGFLPMVGELLPSLGIEFKNSEGEVIELDDAIVMQNGSELKVWQTVAEYAMSFNNEDSEISTIPQDYNETGNRLILVDGGSLWFWPSVALILISAGVILIVVLYKRGG
ncbi:bifunctional UDP-sugar hydrolase/5'-nucleotidase [soil metagenome]